MTAARAVTNAVLRARLLAAAKAKGLVLEFQNLPGLVYEVLVQAPAGFRFEEDLHELVTSRESQREALVDALRDVEGLRNPVEPCTEDRCDWCGRDGLTFRPDII